MTSASSRCSCSRWCSWTPRRRSPPARWPSAGSSRRSSSSASSCRCSSTRSSRNWVWGGGWLATLGAQLRPRATATSTSPARRSCTWSAAWRRWPARSCSGRASASTTRTATANPIPGHNIPMAIAGTFILAFGWFGFNAGLDAGRRRPAHRRRRRQHDARRRAGRRVRRDALRVDRATASPTRA